MLAPIRRNERSQPQNLDNQRQTNREDPHLNHTKEACVPALDFLREGRLVADTFEAARHSDATRRLLGAASSVCPLSLTRVHHGEDGTSSRVHELHCQLRATVDDIALCRDRDGAALLTRPGIRGDRDDIIAFRVIRDNDGIRGGCPCRL
jgi:hypothetical protein